MDLNKLIQNFNHFLACRKKSWFRFDLILDLFQVYMIMCIIIM